jgi:hypothetical protein
MPDDAVDAINRLADMHEGMRSAIETLAGSICQLAAGIHTKDLPAHRDMAAVFYADADSGFAERLAKLDDKQRGELSDYVAALCKGKRK